MRLCISKWAWLGRRLWLAGVETRAGGTTLWWHGGGEFGASGVVSLMAVGRGVIAETDGAVRHEWRRR